MTANRTICALEALLFAAGEAVPLSGLQKALGIPETEIVEALEALSGWYSSEKRGIKLIEADSNYQLCTNPEYGDIIAAMLQNPQKKTLSAPLIETLAIIAYKQPITKMQIEEIRGVNAEHAVNKLVEFGLACECGRLDAPGRPILFGTTEDFLKFYGLKNLKELPRLPEENTEEFIQLALSDITETADEKSKEPKPRDEAQNLSFL